MEPLKNLLDAAVVKAAARHLQRAASSRGRGRGKPQAIDFDARRFEALALDGLHDLEFKARADHIASALEACLPTDFPAAADLIEASLAPPLPDDPIAGSTHADEGLAGWIVWPLGEFVARRGLGQPARALRCLHALTQRLTAEFALRPFIVHHPQLVFDTLAVWAHDPSAHVRRMASEGSRPRLPWGLRLQAQVADPSPALPLLEALQDDPSDYVRRSVANHLNDIAKDHPALVADWLRRHLPGASDARRALLRHASRTLIKQGHPDVLGLWGLGRPFKGTATLRVSPARLKLGGALRIELDLQSTHGRAQTLEVDYRVHHVRADGSTSPKVFKGWRLELPERGSRSLVKSHAVRPISTRRYYGGRHRIEVQVNGRVVAQAAFLLVVPAG